jgi:hypothetical protein
MIVLHRLVRASSVLTFAVTVLLSSGCGGEKLYSVSGKVTVGDQPLTAGMVSLTPDTSKGNKGSAGPIGPIKSDGTYSLTTEGKTGAPAGWYKVCILPGMPSMGTDLKPDGKAPPMPKLGINPKYGNPSTTDLVVEVKASGGPYDLKPNK